MVCNNIPMDTISFAVSIMEMISASVDDKAGTFCFLEKNLMQHPLSKMMAPETGSKP